MKRTLLAALIVLWAGCDADLLGRSCTEIGCVDQLSLTFRAPDNRWREGAYRIELELEGEALQCAFSVPAALPAQLGSVGQVECGRGASAYFSAETLCTETRTRDAVSHSCTPRAGEWTLQLSRSGTPARLEVRVTRDEQEVASLSETVKYRENRPNGPDCEPLCRQAQLEIAVE